MKTIVGFLSRNHGLEVLYSLIKLDNYKILKILTHSKLPSSENPLRPMRDEFKIFQKICNQNCIPLEIVDSKFNNNYDIPKCDFIIEISWRYLIPKEILKNAKIASFGIHRGKLPEYAGPEPIKQAIINSENELVISSHLLENEIDAGETLFSKNHKINYDKNSTLENNISRLKQEITPYFSELVITTLNKFK